MGIMASFVFVCCALKTEAALIPTNAFCFTPPVLSLCFNGFKPIFLPVFKTSLKELQKLAKKGWGNCHRFSPKIALRT
jgi:hypothetical protein